MSIVRSSGYPQSMHKAFQTSEGNVRQHLFSLLHIRKDKATARHLKTNPNLRWLFLLLGRTKSHSLSQYPHDYVNHFIINI